MSKFPQELAEARKLLGESDMSSNDLVRIEKFKDGMDILLDFIDGAEDPQEKRIADNMVESNFRRLIQHIGNLATSGREASPEVWWKYIALMIEYLRKFQVVIEKNPALKKAQDDFLDLYREDLIAFLEEQRRELEAEI